MTRLVSGFIAALDSENNGTGITQDEWAQTADLSTSMVSRFTSEYKLSEKMFPKLFHCWSKPETGRRLLILYLEDEIERAGWSNDDIMIKLSNEDPDMHLNNALVLINKHMNKFPSLRDVIKDYGSMIDDHEKLKIKKYTHSMGHRCQHAEVIAAGSAPFCRLHGVACNEFVQSETACPDRGIDKLPKIY